MHGCTIQGCSFQAASKASSRICPLGNTREYRPVAECPTSSVSSVTVPFGWVLPGPQQPAIEADFARLECAGDAIARPVRQIDLDPVRVMPA